MNFILEFFVMVLDLNYIKFLEKNPASDIKGSFLKEADSLKKIEQKKYRGVSYSNF